MPSREGNRQELRDSEMTFGAVLGAMTKLVQGRHLLDLNEPLDPGLVPDDDLQGKLRDVVGDILHDVPANRRNRYAFAVVDLTTSPRAPAYAGWNDRQPRRIDSLAKLLPLYSAFELRANLRQLSQTLSIGDRTTLATATRAHYSLWRADGAARPWIEKLFTVSAPGQVDFVSSRRPGNLEYTFDDLDREHHNNFAERRIRTKGLLGSDPSKLEFELNRLAFREQLRLMAGWSDNVAAAVVIHSLDFPHLWARTKGSGLYRLRWDPLTMDDAGRSGPGGLFLANDYNSAPWKNRPTNVPAGDPITVPGGSGTQGNARSLAVLLMMLAQGRLVDPQSDAGMREMLRKTEPHFTSRLHAERSPIGQGMARPRADWSSAQSQWLDNSPLPDPQSDLAVSKIGLLGADELPGDPGSVSNGLLVQTKHTGAAPRSAPITAVLVGINDADEHDEVLQGFGEGMAKKLNGLHP